MTLLKYIYFLAKSTNQHGVHSPFVYDFITKCLYSRKKIDGKEFYSATIEGINPKQYNLLLKSMRYFGVKTVFVDSENLKNAILGAGIDVSVDVKLKDNQKYDIIFLQNISQPSNITSLLTYMHNNSVLIINNLYKNTPTLAWQEFTSHPQVTACINIFTQGYIFIRNEQGKEFFYIRV